MGRLPTGSDRIGWHKHYAKIFNTTGRHTAEHLTIWYLLLHLAFDPPSDGIFTGEPSHG